MAAQPKSALRARLISRILELKIVPDLDLNEDTSLIRSGLFDSAAILELAVWIQAEVGAGVDILEFDLSNEWDTIAGIERFIERHGAAAAAD